MANILNALCFLMLSEILFAAEINQTLPNLNDTDVQEEFQISEISEQPNQEEQVKQASQIEEKLFDEDYLYRMKEWSQEYNLETGRLLYNKMVKCLWDCIETVCLKKAQVIDDVIGFQNQASFYGVITQPTLPPLGIYAKPIVCYPWVQSRHKNDEVEQGIKLHVSAKPETALKIAEIVLPILEENKVNYKIIYDLKQMRYLYYLDQYEVKEHIIGDGHQSAQAGKFIVIYTKSLEQAQMLVHQIERSFQEHQITPDDFVPVLGDAQIGKSGGIFGRYGAFSVNNILPVNSRNKMISYGLRKRYNIPQRIPDQRVYPWPDYMNNRELYDGDLFGDLEVIWVNPYKPEEVITWAYRPQCWAELEGKLCS